MHILSPSAHIGALILLAGLAGPAAPMRDAAEPTAESVQSASAPAWGVLSGTPSPGMKPDSRDFAICDLAARSRPDEFEAYLVSTFVPPPRRGAPARLEVRFDGGTMGAQELVAIDGIGQITHVEDGHMVMDDESVPIDSSKRLMPHAGRVYALGFVGEAPIYLQWIGRVLGDGTLLPVCRLKQRAEIRLGSMTDGDGPVCSAASAGKLAYLPVRERKTGQVEIPSGSHRGFTGTLDGEIDVDFRNDGKPERLLRYAYSSGAGSGCDGISYSLASGAAARSSMLLDGLHDRRLADNGTPREVCRDRDARWFRFGGRTYLDIASVGQDAVAENQEYRFIASVDRGVARRICEARSMHPAPKLIARWNGLGWTLLPTTQNARRQR